MVAFLIAAVLPLGVSQAPDFGGKEQAEKMAALRFLLGEWEGKATYDTPQGKFETDSYEKVEEKAGGTAMFVTGRHTMKLPNGESRMVHDAAALIRYDTGRKAYRMRAQIASGASEELDVTVVPKGVRWEVVSTAGTMRYTMNLTAAGEWHEIGEAKVGDGWRKVIDMRLKPKPTHLLGGAASKARD